MHVDVIQGRFNPKWNEIETSESSMRVSYGHIVTLIIPFIFKQPSRLPIPHITLSLITRLLMRLRTIPCRLVLAPFTVHLLLTVHISLNNKNQKTYTYPISILAMATVLTTKEVIRIDSVSQ